MSWALSNLLGLVVVVAMLLMVAGLLAPFEALGWWAGWYGDAMPPADALAATVPKRAPTGTTKQHYVVFLSGINTFMGGNHTEREKVFLERLEQRLPDIVPVDDIFPYAVTNRSLTGQRLFSWFWRWCVKQKLQGPALAGFLINLRNGFQVAVSADGRYGPIYNQGSAEMILQGLVRHGYKPGNASHITMIGYSGGAQIALGAVPHLREVIHAPVSLISLGGVIGSGSGVNELHRLYHLYGARDRVQQFGLALSPGRWPLFFLSPWNEAKADGLIVAIPMGPTDHTGPSGYLDTEATLPDGRSYLEATLETITRLITDAPMGDPPPPQGEARVLPQQAST